MLDKLQRSIDINDKTYRIQVLGGLEGIRMGNKLLKVILPVLGGGLDGLKADDTFETPKTWTNLTLLICDKIDDLNVEELITTLLKGCTVIENGQVPRDININIDFMANYGELVLLIEFALKENFGSLFTEKGILQSLTKVMSKLVDNSPQE